MPITDYTPYLRVTEDGLIWWVHSDAIRLGAGFLPVSDDHHALEPELRATSNRARANERTLIGAFGDVRLNIERPMTFERDGFRYVEATAFLDWLSQYIAQTQAGIAFPNALVNEVKKAKAKEAASRAPAANQDFDSLTLALEGWFDKAVDELPVALRERAQNEFFPMPWDALNADQRRSVTLQLDYQHDPATERDRKFWWDLFVRMDELQAQITTWKAADTPTASDVAVKESRLKELERDLARMKQQERQVGGDYYPEQKRLENEDVTAATPSADIQYIAFPKAMQLLADRLDATREELAAWIFFGPEIGGLAAYTNELDPPPRFHFDCFMGEDYLSPLMACWFTQEDIEHFEPGERYITGKALIERWSKQPNIEPEAFIRAKIAESRLMEFHPTFGGTEETFPKLTGFPPLSSGLFVLAHVERIEAEDGLDVEPAQPPAVSASDPISPAVPAFPTTSPEIKQQLIVPVAPPGDPCAAFHQMEKLHPSEIKIALVGDKSDSGLSGNNMLEISARGETRRLALAEFGLVDRRNGVLTKQAAVLVGLAHGKQFRRNVEKNSATMMRLRKTFRERLGVTADPFAKHCKDAGWQPLFTITDQRGKADERARLAAERPGSTLSLDQLQDQGHQFAAIGGMQNWDDEDAGGKWLEENDPHHRT